MSWRESFNEAREAENGFRGYAEICINEVNETSEWVKEKNIVRFKIGPNPFDESVLKRYFKDYLNDYRSGLDQMIYKYCEYHGQNERSSEFPIRLTREELEGRIRGWRGWDEVHKRAIFDFIASHSPFTDATLYGSLVILSKLRNTNSHRMKITPVPEVKVDKKVKLFSENGSVSFTPHSPVNQDPNKAWNINDYDSEAQFGEFYGVGYETSNPAYYEGVVFVRFEATDPTDSDLAPVDVLSFMTVTTAAIKKIEEDFMKEFDYLFQ